MLPATPHGSYTPTSGILQWYVCPRGLTLWWGCYGLCLTHKPTELAHSFLFCSCVCFCLYGPFNCISFHKSSRQLSAFSLCSPSLISDLLVLSTIYLFLQSKKRRKKKCAALTRSPRDHLQVVGMLRFMFLTQTNRACLLLFILFLCLFLSLWAFQLYFIP